MRNFKKYFFESLIQLTILANVFRQNNRYTSLTGVPFFTNQFETNHFSFPAQNYTSGDLELLLLNEHLNHPLTIEHPNNQELSSTTHLIKEAEYSENIAIERLYRLTRPDLPQSIVIQRPIVLQPASAVYNSCQQKGVIDRSEMRILLNSLELNYQNNNTLRKEFEMDIELQTLIEQDIDLGIKNNFFYQIESQQKNNQDMSYQFNSDFIKMKNSFQSQFEESQKNEDILMATKFMENEFLGDRKLFVEEDTGEIIYQNRLSNNYDQHPSSNLNTTDNSNLTNKQLSDVEMSVKHKPSDQQIVFTKPIFLSQISVCKELNKLNENNASTSNQSAACTAASSNITLGSSTPAIDERMLNEYIEENLLSDGPKTSFDIQQDLETANILTTDDSVCNNSTDMIPDILEFDEDFLKTFESNLNKFNAVNDSNNGSLITQASDNIYFNQTILESNTNSTVVPSLNHQEYFQQEPESINFLSDQLDLSLDDFFKTFNGSQSSSSLSTNFSTFNNLTDSKNLTSGIDQMKTSNQPSHHIPNSILISHDDVRVLNTNATNFTKIGFKQEPKDANDTVLVEQDEQTEHTSSYTSVDYTTEEAQAVVRGLNHNHTYMDGAKTEEDSEVYHPYSYKNKLKKMLKNLKNSSANSSRQQESRDQVLLQENNILLSIDSIVESSADEFNDIVSTFKLNSEQLSIVKDIRRRGKNKVAAQICRKRKIDSIDSLKEDVENLNEIKASLDDEQKSLENEITDLTLKFDELYQDLMDGEYDRNDPIVIYMNNLKTQLNINSRLKQMQQQQQQQHNSISRNSDDSESNSQDYETSSQHSQSFDVTESEFEDEDEEKEESLEYLENLFPNKKLKVKQGKSEFFSKKVKN